MPLASLVLWLGTAPAAEPPCSIQAVSATGTGGDTRVAIALSRPAPAEIQTEGSRVRISIPGARAGSALAAQTRTGGLVRRIAVESAPAPRQPGRVTLDLEQPCRAEAVPTGDARLVAVRLSPAAEGTGVPAPRLGPGGIFDAVEARDSDAAALLQSLAREADVSLVMAGAVSKRVTVGLRGVTFERALDYLAKSAGLAWRRDGDAYVVGEPKDLEAAYPPSRPEPQAPPKPPVLREEVYQCVHVSAPDLVATLTNTFGKDQLSVSLGAGAHSPRLSEGSSVKATGVAATVIRPGEEAAAQASTRQVVLYGEESVVARAVALARRLDVRRPQVRIGVAITDIATDALKELGIRWSWSNFTVREERPSGINFGAFTHNPVTVDAALSALERDDRARLLAAPTLSLLDGEQGFILIGDRIQFPKLIGYTQAATPIFDKEEERVGIYLQVAVRATEDGEITMTIYPQVSVVTGFLNVNGASYPQISTREQQTTIRVRSGEKIVVGGLLRQEDLASVQRVPLLSRIPLFGELFTHRRRTRRQSELIITITPELLKE